MKETRETKIILDVFNGDWSNWPPQYSLSQKSAAKIRASLIAAHQKQSVRPVTEGIREYAGVMEVWPTSDGRSLRLVKDVSTPEQRIYAALVREIFDKRFFALRPCRECGQFFLPQPKQRYCKPQCLMKSNRRKAQQRVERARRNSRRKEIIPKLLRLREMAKSTPPLEILDRLPGFDPNLLSRIIEGERLVRQLALEVKYKNRRILMEAKI